MNVSPVVVFIGLWLLAAVAIVVLGRRQAKKVAENTRRLAGELGLQVEERPPVWGVFHRSPEVGGHFEGKATRLYPFSTGSGKNRQRWTAMAMLPRRRGELEVRLSPEGFGNKLRGLFGYKEIKLGDERFDANWYVETNQPEFLREALVPELRQRLQQLRSAGLKGVFETRDGEVRYVERGSLGGDAQTRRFRQAAGMVSLLVEVVEVAAK